MLVSRNNCPSLVFLAAQRAWSVLQKFISYKCLLVREIDGFSEPFLWGARYFIGILKNQMPFFVLNSLLQIISRKANDNVL